MANKLAEQSVEMGDFRTVVDLLNTTATDTADLALRAWAQLECGETSIALASATSLLKEKLNPVDHARSLAVIGRAKARLGRTSEGLSSLKRAVAIASAHSTHLEAELRAQHVAAALNWVGVEPALAELPSLRRAALESGHRIALAEYHIVYARIAALRGWWKKTSTESKAATELLKTSDHLATRWRLAQCQASVAIMSGDLAEAIAWGQQGLELSARSQSKSKHASALANLAHIWGVAGDYQQSIAFLNKSHQLLERDSQIRFATLSTGIIVGLRAEDYTFADEMLRQGEELANAFPEDTYYRLWFALHRVTWLMYARKFREAANSAAEALKSIGRLADADLTQRLRLLLSEALSLDGAQAEALSVFGNVARGGMQPTLEVVAEIERVAGVLRRDADRNGATQSLASASRILSSAHLVGPRADVTRTALRLNISPPSAETAPANPMDPAAVATQVALLLRLGRYPKTLALETLAFLQACNTCSSASLFELSDEQRMLIAAFGSSTQSESQSIRIGEGEGIRYVIDACPIAFELFTFLRLALEQLTTSAIASARAALDTEPPSPWPFEAASLRDGMVVSADSMAELLGTVKRLAPSTITVLLTGETGTGKELLARALHDTSPRANKPFIPFNCSGVSRDMLDAQLFGYRKGAFTGATEPFQGVIRAAAGGTLFLDEIGEVALDVQPKLLRFLESGEIHPLGELRPLKVDVRVVAATNADLEKMVDEGRFREDLFYRLNVVRLQVPPLRERREEIPALVQHYLDRCSRESQKTGLRIADETMEYLILYRWPGNVRQLANEVRRMVALAESGAVLMPEHLSQPIASSRRTIPTTERYLAPTEFVVRVDQPMSAALEHVERSMIQYALKLSGGKLEDAAHRLGLSRKGLYLKRQRLGLGDPQDELPPSTTAPVAGAVDLSQPVQS
jgi:DNA-binding NtrC family response regulator/tetratricopeptide (TPR) repeat protein